jgi:hypothetical protein
MVLICMANLPIAGVPRAGVSNVSFGGRRTFSRALPLLDSGTEPKVLTVWGRRLDLKLMATLPHYICQVTEAIMCTNFRCLRLKTASHLKRVTESLLGLVSPQSQCFLHSAKSK